MLFELSEGDITQYRIIWKTKAAKVYQVYYRKRVEKVEKSHFELEQIKSLRSKH